MNSPHTTTIREANAALLERGDIAAVATHFAPAYTTHVTAGDRTSTHESIQQYVEVMRRSFAGLHVEVEILVESGDRVAWQRTFTGTHEAKFQGFPPTKRELRWRDMVTTRFENGLIAEEWVVTDMAEQLLRARKNVATRPAPAGA